MVVCRVFKNDSKFLHEIHKPRVPPHEPLLKESAIWVLMRNLFLENGRIKNARGVIKKLLEKVIEVELVQTSVYEESKRTYHLPRIMFEFQPRFCLWIMQRKQFSLHLTYATTFNSHQGLILDRAVIDL